MEKSNNLLNFDIITPNKNVIALIGQVSKLNIFEFSGSQEFESEGLFSTKIFGIVEIGILLKYINNLISRLFK